MNIEFSSENKRIKPSEVVDYLLSRGQNAISSYELSHLLQVPENELSNRLRSVRAKGAIFSPTHGLWVVVNPEYRTWEAPPPSEYITDLMNTLHTEYYIGWLSAAEYYGAAHHAPQVFQVATSRDTKDRTIGRSRLYFYRRSLISQANIRIFPTRSNQARVSSPLWTALDLATDIEISGGINNVVNVVAELAEHEDFSLSDMRDCYQHFPTSTLRRLGWILQEYSDIKDLQPLKQLINNYNTVSLLTPQNPVRGHVDKIWNLKINADVEVDI
jgi:predicted transcriptional regulator of viral defense system